VTPAVVPKPGRTETKSIGPKGAPAPKVKKSMSHVGLDALAPKAVTPPPIVLTPLAPNVADTDKVFGDASISEFMDVLNESVVNVDDSIGSLVMRFTSRRLSTKRLTMMVPIKRLTVM
jgi:hypothetical protein